ncbi:DNA-binding response regulator [Streptomyces melanogenes]|nr:DNA-binding response regulator [Streptomyces melanogenes]
MDAVRTHRPDIVLVDINMPRVDGLAATRELLGGGAFRPRVIVLTAHALDEHLYAALDAGADGFIVKDISPHDLIAAVRTVQSGDALISPSMTRRLIDRYACSTAVRANRAQEQLDRLSGRQRRTLALLARGLSNAQIGVELGITESRVKAQVSELLGALGVANRVQAATLACTAGLLDS